MQLLDSFAHSEVLGVDFAGFSEFPYCYASIDDASLKRGLPDMPLLIKSGFMAMQPSSARALGWMVNHSLPAKSVRTDAPPGIEIVLNRQGNRHILHLINHYYGVPSFGTAGLNSAFPCQVKA